MWVRRGGIHESQSQYEHAEEADQKEVANGVGVVIREGDGGSVLVILKEAAAHSKRRHSSLS